MEIEEIPFVSWEHFHSKFNEFIEPFGKTSAHSSARPRYIFRGVGDTEWRLETTFGRAFRQFGDTFSGDERKQKLKKVERLLMNLFVSELGLLDNSSEYLIAQTAAQTHGEGFPSSPVEAPSSDEKSNAPEAGGCPFGADNIELWALGQHFGLPTNLLDWTDSPYIAAWFAFSSVFKNATQMEYGDIHTNSNRVAIWALRYPTAQQTTIAENETSSSNPLASEEAVYNLWRRHRISFFETRYARNPRLKAQRGLFTRIPSSKVCMEDIFAEIDDAELEAIYPEYEHEHLPLVAKFTLPHHCLVDAISDLRYMDITPTKLFRDLNGACESAHIALQTQLFSD